MVIKKEYSVIQQTMRLSLTLFLSAGVSLAQAADVAIPATAALEGLTTLVTAVGLAGLGGKLSETGPFTVFAPTNEAFDKLDKALLLCLLNDTYIDELTTVLTYHVASGNVTSGDLTNNQKITTLQGSTAKVTIAGSVVKINEATVKTADVSASNGVVHVIDQVLIPSGNDGVDALIAKCATASTSTASTILGVAIPLIGMLATAVAVIV